MPVSSSYEHLGIPFQSDLGGAQTPTNATSKTEAQQEKIFSGTDSNVYDVDINGSIKHAGNLFETMPANAQFYWKMMPPNRAKFATAGENIDFAGFGPAPRLQPSNATAGAAFGGMYASHALESMGSELSWDKPSTIVNVRDMHHWTESPISSRREVPVLNLKEYRITANAMVNQMINSMGMAVTSGLQVWEGLKDLLSGNLEEVVQTISNNLPSSGSIGQQSFTGSSTQSADPMNPYSMLYTTAKTGFKYVLPYMSDTWADVNSSFGGDGHQTGGIVAGLSEFFQSAAADFANLGIGLMTPGMFREVAEFFNFSGRERSYTVSFPLFNTKSYAEVIRNWQFLFLLHYQCLPNRINRQSIDPPCIYEAYVPGVWYSKYTVISNLKIDFQGARREMEVPITFLDLAENNVGGDAGNSKWLQQMRKMMTIIPDAYKVTITLTELFGDSQNSKYQLMRESMNEKIRTGTVPQTP
jgi:hypothetical protein